MKKFIIIGAGIAGASTAYHLAKAGAEVVIVDRRDKGQATDAAAGIVCPWLSQRRNKAWYQLAKNGARYYPKLIDELKKEGETATGYSQVGAINIHKDTAKLLAMEKRALERRKDAPEIGRITLLSPEKTKAMFPPLGEGFGAIHVSGAARVDGRALRDALLRVAVKFGAELLYGDAKLLFEGQHIKGVSVKDMLLYADTTIIAAGAWANQLLEPLGLDLRIHFQKAQIIHLQLPGYKTERWPVVMPPTDQYLLAFNNQRIIAGATHENTDRFDTTATAGGLEELLGKALEIAPGLSNSSLLETRVGFRPFTPGFLPIIGPVPGLHGLLLINGLGSSGLTMAPYIGSELAKSALEFETEIDLSPYAAKC